MPDAPSGLLIVDKASEWTSHDVVAKLRGVLRTKKVGHAGTLDPDATGVLLVGVGKVTRLLRFLTVLPKAYTGEIVLGVETSTLDASGDVVETYDMTGTTIDDARAAATKLVGPIMQVPPMVSAVQVDGKRLHELARKGIEVEREARPVTVHEFSVEATDDPMVLRANVHCSSGTYVRTLAADLGTALGGGAHLRNLRRTAIGEFTLDRAKPIEAISQDDLLRPATAMSGYDAVTVSPGVAAAVGHGKVLPPDTLGVEGEGPWAVLDESGELLAVYERRDTESVKPAVVL